MRGFLLLGFALCIDGLQWAVDAGAFVIGNFAGTIAGTAAGCAGGQAVAGQVGCAVGGAVGGFAGSWLNVPAAVVGVPLGIILGMVMSFCISALFGGMLVMLLAQSGMFYSRYIIGGTLAEVVPGINTLPSWTLMTWLCISAKKAEEGSLAASLVVAASSPTSALRTAAGATLSQEGAGVAAQARAGEVGSSQQKTPSSAARPMPLALDGIRPHTKTNAPLPNAANDNARQTIAYAA